MCISTCRSSTVGEDSHILDNSASEVLWSPKQGWKIQAGSESKTGTPVLEELTDLSTPAGGHHSSGIIVRFPPCPAFVCLMNRKL